MDSITKRFWRVFLLIGLPSGLIWAVFIAIDHDLKFSVIAGAILGFFTGLLMATVVTRESSKNTCPIVLDPSPRTQVETNEFQPQGFPRSLAVVGVGIIVFLVVSIIFDSLEMADLEMIVLLAALFFLGLFNWLIRYAFTRLNISKDGIEHRSLLYKITVGWEEVEQIERRGKRWFLICQASKISAWPFVSAWLKFMDADKMIPLDAFASNFPESELAGAIFHYDDQIRVVGTV